MKYKLGLALTVLGIFSAMATGLVWFGNTQWAKLEKNIEQHVAIENRVNRVEDTSIEMRGDIKTISERTREMQREQREMKKEQRLILEEIRKIEK